MKFKATIVSIHDTEIASIDNIDEKDFTTWLLNNLEKQRHSNNPIISSKTVYEYNLYINGRLFINVGTLIENVLARLCEDK